ncbi:glyoxylase-like metal-dependent hydrolase (beta-lactamase superfamily II) [Paenibacillus phyllosphaerae]|uniref:Glyoxylase-like metal-dependent hydrolase (Beta-lactamase superfamily II) n=1 Tax=Paenibacillus phyllosphaerae TaxID=274593 RepID=A0A7W5AVX7_9BACL|nr:MBL fold metallo-hydrolase [Paenibacillus phyllosphaerae]MBB3109688.1 glyoxylase-like metal-dependent hydrolase (beta-lactamase superfamily II) [Paenibacillus phyllosphaerae]
MTLNATPMKHAEGTQGVNSEVLVELKLYAAGYCRHPEFLTLRGGSFKPVPFPAGFACIRHPLQGCILFDTGYSARFFEETKRFPAALYRMITPVTFDSQDSAMNQLLKDGIPAEEIRYVVLSHFHADHTAGLRDFPHARLLYKQEAYSTVNKLGTFASVRAGYLPGLLPDDFENRSLLVEETPRLQLPNDFPFEAGYDLFGDGSIIAVDVPGHAAGQIGLLLTTAEGAYFLCADAVWSSIAYRERRKPHAVARIIMDDPRSYDDSFERLCRLHEHYPHIRIIPSHCLEPLQMGIGEGKT